MGDSEFRVLLRSVLIKKGIYTKVFSLIKYILNIKIQEIWFIYDSSFKNITNYLSFKICYMFLSTLE